MGNVEKVVVLTVLFLVTVILVVSLTTEDPARAAALDARSELAAAPAAGGPGAEGQEVSGPGAAAARGAGQPLFGRSEERLASAANPTGAARTDGASGESGTSRLLSSTVERSSIGEVGGGPGDTDSAGAADAPQETPPAELPDGSLIVTAEGLETSSLDVYRFYVWRAGDTLESVARRYYGDAARAALLRHYNEGNREFEDGQKILVPVFDLDAEERSEPRRATPAGQRVHTVAEGDSLWKIAKDVYGNGARWNEIFVANQDVLASPEGLRAGMQLRIP